MLVLHELHGSQEASKYDWPPGCAACDVVAGAMGTGFVTDCAWFTNGFCAIAVDAVNAAAATRVKTNLDNRTVIVLFQVTGSVRVVSFLASE